MKCKVAQFILPDFKNHFKPLIEYGNIVKDKK